MTVTDLRRIDTTPTSKLRGPDNRWRPTRAGLLNVWQYEDETFQFEKGRLVLYGPNGSGKTMALELLFPYLLDANARAAQRCHHLAAVLGAAEDVAAPVVRVLRLPLSVHEHADAAYRAMA